MAASLHDRVLTHTDSGLTRLDYLKYPCHTPNVPIKYCVLTKLSY